LDRRYPTHVTQQPQPGSRRTFIDTPARTAAASSVDEGAVLSATSPDDEQPVSVAADAPTSAAPRRKCRRLITLMGMRVPTVGV